MSIDLMKTGYMSSTKPSGGRKPADPELAARVTRARKGAGLTQEEAAELLGDATAKAISQWENAARKISIQRLEQMARVYRVDIAYLLLGDAAYAGDQDLAPIRARIEPMDEAAKRRALRALHRTLDLLDDGDAT